MTNIERNLLFKTALELVEELDYNNDDELVIKYDDQLSNFRFYKVLDSIMYGHSSPLKNKRIVNILHNHNVKNNKANWNNNLIYSIDVDLLSYYYEKNESLYYRLNVIIVNRLESSSDYERSRIIDIICNVYCETTFTNLFFMKALLLHVNDLEELNKIRCNVIVPSVVKECDKKLEELNLEIINKHLEDVKYGE